jgi:glutamate N-acetyltransferase/amino-acid N-acetyltransferase
MHFTIFPIDGSVCAADGFYADGVSAGLKPNDKQDVAIVYSSAICKVDAVFTKNNFKAAPLLHFMAKGEFETNCVLVNAKNANAMTGDEGIADIDVVLDALVAKFPQIKNPVMSSTGVIGARLPKEKIIASFDKINLEEKDFENAANAIMTTDRWQKTIAFRVELEDKTAFKIGAMAKGAGMINPQLATMLCFITTDAAVPAGHIKPMLQEAAHTTFNAVSVDGDTSTNDTVMLLANGLSGVYLEEAFKEALRLIMQYLALEMVKDGEGANKLAAFEVKNAATNEDAEIAAKALSNSLLVKTALFGEDPNWGRIASTIGASGVQCDPKTLTITYDDVVIYEKGISKFDAICEEKAGKVLKKDEFKIICDLGQGVHKFTAYGCDLGYEYVKINADYRT